MHTPLQGRADLVAKYDAKPKGQLHDHAVMAAMIESVDTGVGRIIDALKNLGLKDNTVILFTSDNGGYGPATSMQPLKGYKGTYYEGGIREPFFVNWPGVVPADSKCEVPIINVDLYPTLCEITGAEASRRTTGRRAQSRTDPERGIARRRCASDLFGISLPICKATNGSTNSVTRCFAVALAASSVKEGGSCTSTSRTARFELYDLNADIGEQTNLAAIHPELASELRQN